MANRRTQILYETLKQQKRKPLRKRQLVAPETHQKGGFQEATNKRLWNPAMGKHPFR
jgi:hypothetical protein